MKLRARFPLLQWRPSGWLSKSLIAAGAALYIVLIYQLVAATRKKVETAAEIFPREAPLSMPRKEAPRPSPDAVSSLDMVPLMLVKDAEPPPQPKPTAEPEPEPEPSAGGERPEQAKPAPAPEPAPQKRAFTHRERPAQRVSTAASAAFLANPKVRKKTEPDANPAPAAAAPPSKKARDYRDTMGRPNVH